MAENKLLGVDEVAETVGVSRSYAYRVIRKLNDELQETDHYVVPRKVNRAYLIEKLFAIHQAYIWEENVERLVESTNIISPHKSKLAIEGSALNTLLSSPTRTKCFLESREYIDLNNDLNRRTSLVKDAIVVASLINNVNLRGRVIEELITSDDPEIISSIKQSLRDGVRLSIKTDQ